MNLPEVIGSKFMYFGYGSNLLSKRIHLQNDSAQRKGYGKLEDYQLQFYSNSERWKGATATIVPKPGSHVMGAIWEIDLKHLPKLDEQESVSQGMYIPLSLPIILPDGSSKICRVYRLNKLPDKILDNKSVPEDQKPSCTYLKTIIKGAIETGLPNDYIEFLKSFQHNKNICDDFEEILDLKSFSI